MTTRRFSDLAAAIGALPDKVLVLDGVVAVFDERLVSRFDRLAEPDPELPTIPARHRRAVHPSPANRLAGVLFARSEV